MFCNGLWEDGLSGHRGPQKFGGRHSPHTDSWSETPGSAQSSLKWPGDDGEVRRGPIFSYGRACGEALTLLQAWDEGAGAQPAALMHFCRSADLKSPRQALPPPPRHIERSPRGMREVGGGGRDASWPRGFSPLFDFAKTKHRVQQKRTK